MTAPRTDMPDAWETVQLARHPQRPHTRDYIGCLCSEFVELRGDRGLGDDPAIVGGLGRTSRGTAVILGYQKGRNIEENVRQHFGMPYPEGFHKLARLIRHAEKFGMPLICLLDTPGCQVDQHAEALGQMAALGETLLAMANVKVPIISVVIGEASAGAALALGIADRFLMLENTIFSVASPEASALQLWQDVSLAADAARAMKITANDIFEMGLVDEIVAEPASGAHTDCDATVQATVGAILRHLELLQTRTLDHMLWQRYARYRAIGQFYEHDFDLAAAVHAGKRESVVAR